MTTIKPQLEKLFKDKKLSKEDFNVLIIEYIKKETEKEPSVEELNLINQLFVSGIFNLDYVIDIIGKKSKLYGIQISNLYSKNGDLIKRYVYDLIN